MRVQKAFIVYHPGMKSKGIYKAETASKARYAAYLGAKDAGFDFKLIDMIVRRAKEYDNYNIRSGIDIAYIHYYAP